MSSNPHSQIPAARVRSPARQARAPPAIAGSNGGVPERGETGGTHMTRRNRIAAALVVLALAAASMSFAQQTDKLGKVEFPNSCSPAVEEKLLRGVAMLHSFYYSAAQKAFGEVAAEDNSCAIAAWGYASILMSNPLQGVGASAKGAELAYGAGQAAAQSGNREKARHYFAQLIELAGSGNARPETEKARRYLASS